MAILFFLVVAFGSKQAVPDVAAALKGNPIPSHERRMARLRASGHDTESQPKPHTMRDAVRANVRNAAERAAVKRDAKHSGKLAYLTDNWEQYEEKKRQKLHNRAARKQTVVKNLIKAKDLITEHRVENKAWRENQRHDENNPEPTEQEPRDVRAELDELLAEIPEQQRTDTDGNHTDDPERIRIPDPDYPGTRDVSIAELQRRRARQEQDRNAAEHRAARDHEAQQQREAREHELRMQAQRQQETDQQDEPEQPYTTPRPGNTRREQTGSGAGTAESEPEVPVRAHAERIREEPAALEPTSLDAQGEPIEDAEVVEDPDTPQPTPDNTSSTDAGGGEPPLATVTPINIKKENGMAQIEGGIEGATGKLDELAEHFEQSNGTVTSTREAFEQARWSGVPMERMEAATTKIAAAIEDLQAAAQSIREGGYSVRDALEANSQVGDDESVRAQ